MTDSHHIKTYIIFFLISFLLVGLLVYLYMPFGASRNLTSDALMSQENTMSNEIKITTDVSSDELTLKRQRLTNLLLRAQSELAGLESDKKNLSLTDGEKKDRIGQLRIKIDNLQIKITGLTK